MIKDKSKGMRVNYNVLNLPQSINIVNDFVIDGNINYIYSADGVKRHVSYNWTEENVVHPIIGNGFAVDIGNALPSIYSKSVDYAGNKIYVNGQLDMILLGNGYIKDNEYYFYLRDHLGNNRVVIQSLPNDLIDPGAPEELEVGVRGGQFAKVVQRTDYYPSGLPFPNSLNPDLQQFKYNGKEFDTMHGLNQYDYGARFYDAAIMRWHVPVPRVEKYIWISPYAYAANNPIRFIDWMGLEPGEPEKVNFLRRYWNAMGNPWDPMNQWGFGPRDGNLQTLKNVTAQDVKVASGVIGAFLAGGAVIETAIAATAGKAAVAASLKTALNTTKIVVGSASVVNNVDNALSNKAGESKSQQMAQSETAKQNIDNVKAFVNFVSAFVTGIKLGDASNSLFGILSIGSDAESVIDKLLELLLSTESNEENNSDNSNENDYIDPFDNDADLKFYKQSMGGGNNNNGNRNKGNLQHSIW
jgi:RHS repeat-associated protein